MDVLDLLKLMEESGESYQTLLSQLSPKKLKNLEESVEYYLLCYPQGTNDAELEELLANLYDHFNPED
jgi:hypothetical protein